MACYSVGFCLSFHLLCRQLPSEYKMFSFVDKAWKEIMRRVEDRPNALRSAITPGTLDTLQQANASLEKIQKCLEVGFFKLLAQGESSSAVHFWKNY